MVVRLCETEPKSRLRSQAQRTHSGKGGRCSSLSQGFSIWNKVQLRTSLRNCGNGGFLVLCRTAIGNAGLPSSVYVYFHFLSRGTTAVSVVLLCCWTLRLFFNRLWRFWVCSHCVLLLWTSEMVEHCLCPAFCGNAHGWRLQVEFSLNSNWGWYFSWCVFYNTRCKTILLLIYWIKSLLHVWNALRPPQTKHALYLWSRLFPEPRK